ncbi:MAG: glycosyl hydrolase [Candidatus Omnitrophica bacterium]|nr:glycosyl hydrolase [Candidatus Omnitrophota bacterium]
MSRTLSRGEPLAFGAPEVGETVDIRIDSAKPHQTLLGLGSSLEHTTCWNLWRLSPERRAEALERLVSRENGIGMNLMRICIGTPDFTGEPWYSYDDMPPGETDEALEHFSIEKDLAYVIPVLKLALEKNPDLLFYASPWSPPGWMKTSDDLIGGHLYPKYYGVYARYFLKFIRAYEAQGIPIHAVTIQNEPGVNTRDHPKSWWYPSCQWSLVVDEDTWFPPSLDIMGHPERDFIRDHLGPLFKEQGVKTRIWCYDHNLNNLWYPRAILSDPIAGRYVDGTAFHPYSGAPSDMGAFWKEFPDKKVYLSEGSMFGIEGAVSIIEYLRNGASSYNAWVTLIDSEGKPNNGPFKASKTCVMLDSGTLEVTHGFEYYMYGQFMKFIHRGAVRIDSGESGSEFAHVAFLNPDGSLVLVVANPLSRSRDFRVGWEGSTFRGVIGPESVATYRWRAN